MKNDLLAPYLLTKWMICYQTFKVISFNHWERVYNGFGFGDFDPFFKIMCKFILKIMILSLEPMDGFFFQTCKGISVWSDDLNPILGSQANFPYKICLEPVDGFHLTYM